MNLKSTPFAGDFIAGKFVKNIKADGQFKDISPADLNDHVMTVTYYYEHVDKACKAAKEVRSELHGNSGDPGAS
jgi:succinylglutamic semialdehyde dehydrogenase